MVSGQLGMAGEKHCGLSGERENKEARSLRLGEEEERQRFRRMIKRNLWRESRSEGMLEWIF